MRHLIINLINYIIHDKVIGTMKEKKPSKKTGWVCKEVLTVSPTVRVKL